MRILIVAENQEIIALRQALEKEDRQLQITSVVDPDDAARIFRSGHFAALIIDQNRTIEQLNKISRIVEMAKKQKILIIFPVSGCQGVIAVNGVYVVVNDPRKIIDLIKFQTPHLEMV